MFTIATIMDGAGLTPSGLSWKPIKNHLLRFEPPLGWVQLEFHLLHSQQKIVKILIMIFLSLLFCLSASINKDIISNVVDAFQSCESFLLSRAILLGAT